jgi:hypothetical protein
VRSVSVRINNCFKLTRSLNHTSAREQLLWFWTSPIVLFLFETKRFGELILSPSSRNAYSVWASRLS